MFRFLEMALQDFPSSVEILGNGALPGFFQIFPKFLEGLAEHVSKMLPALFRHQFVQQLAAGPADLPVQGMVPVQFDAALEIFDVLLGISRQVVRDRFDDGIQFFHDAKPPISPCNIFFIIQDSGEKGEGSLLVCYNGSI